MLFIVWDEGTLSSDNRCSASDSTGCGGRVANLVIDPQVKPGYKSTITSSTASNSIIISIPGNGSVISGAIHLLAAASESQAVSETQVWDNGQSLESMGRRSMRSITCHQAHT